jgi:MraZ protein
VYLGASKLSLDNRGRMVVPTKHRDALQVESEGKLTLTRHPDGCLLMLPRSVWDRKSVEIAAWPLKVRNWQRMFLGNASDVELDSAGRVLISPELRAAAHLAIDGKVMLLGVGSHFEIWEAEAHERQEATTSANGFPDDLADFHF